MRIAIDARLYGYENGGPGRYTIHLIEELSTLDSNHTYYILLRKKYFDTLTFPEHFKKVLADAQHYSFDEQITFMLILYKLNPDLVHFLHFNVPLFFGGKSIVTIHDLLMHEGVGKEATTLPFWKYKIKRLAYRLVFDNAVKKAQKIIVPTNFVKTELLKTYKNVSSSKVSVIYEGIPNFSVDSSAKSQSRNPYFLYVGNAYPHKNLKRAIEAAVLLNQKLKVRASFVIVTARSIFAERMSKFVSDNKAEKYVKLVGKVSEKKLASLYSKAAAFVYPSLSEGFGLPPLEAMSVGTPAAVSDIPVFHEVYKNNAIYFDPNDANSIAETLKNILDLKPAQRKNLSGKLIKFAHTYSWAKMARATLGLYESKKGSNSVRQSK